MVSGNDLMRTASAHGDNRKASYESIWNKVVDVYTVPKKKYIIPPFWIMGSFHYLAAWPV
jgi:hypothetical protein